MKLFRKSIVYAIALSVLSSCLLASFAWATAPYTYDYDFGDGTIVVGGASDQTHTYQESGAYTLTVTVTDAIGTVKTATQAITVSELSSSPNTPTLSSPTNGATSISLTPTLSTFSFSDPNSCDTHLMTDWKITVGSSTVLEESSKTNLTSITVPDGTLNEGTTYYWQAQFYDQDSNASGFSNSLSFTTLTTTNDLNSDGIPDSQAVSDSVDMDGDGVIDNLQGDIKSLKTEIGNGQLGVSSKTDSSITDIVKVESIDPDTISTTARPHNMPLGMVSLTLKVISGSTVNTTIYFSEAAPVGAAWFMYDSINGWTDYSSHATFSSDRMSVVLELKDGGFGDADGVANGIIVDPGGFGLITWITGQVYDSSTSQGISNATVSIDNIELKTPASGTFLSPILPGTYAMSVSADGYNMTTLSNVSIAEGAIVTQNLGLSSGNNLYFPYIESDGIWDSEVCIINKSLSSTLAGTLTAYNSSGSVVTTESISLAAKGRTEFKVSTDLASPSSISHMIFSANSLNMTGYTKLFTSSQRIAVPAVSEVNSGDFYVSHIDSSTEWWTKLALLNTTSSSKTVTIVFDTGETKNVTLSANAATNFTIKDLYSGVSQSQIKSATITNGSGVIGVELFASNDGSASNYLSGINLQDTTTSSMYYPHVDHGTDWWTGIVAYNPSASDCTMNISTYNSSGTALATTSQSVSSKSKFIGTPDTLGLPSGTEWFKIEADCKLTGFELFGSTDGAGLGGYTGVNISNKGGVFAKHEDSGWTGIAFVNVEPATATVSLTAYDDSGTTIATASQSVSALLPS